jgi:NADH-quinone oxidoreductase subunit L
MISEAAVWAILGLPLLSFILIALVIRPFFNDKPKLSSTLTILCLAGSTALSVWALISVLDAGVAEHYKLHFEPRYDFLGDFFPGLTFGVMVDGLSATMLVVVSFISLLVQVYSLGYMKGDPGYHRYFAAMSLFTMAMLGVVVSSNLAQIFVFWELVGLCSYMLIGFWFHKPSAAAAAKKAFITTRIGDFGFLLGMLYLYFQAGTLDVAELHALAVGGVLASTVLFWGSLGIFCGAVGKSAQFPLHVWLPDAMEGPTPVSSLIHAATMVAAGVYLVARMFPLFQPVPGEMTNQLYVVAIVGAFTAIFAATMALTAVDIKRVLAYCTLSQLGYMVLGLGTGAFAIAFFHLFNHAFCKCLLFQGAGSVSHCTNTFDMRLMGGLRKGMKWTFWTFLIGSVSMAGIYPLACFWSKDTIVHNAFLLKGDNPLMMVCFIFAMITVFMTAFYMFRAVIMTFFGEYKGGAEPEHGHGGHEEHHGGIHESPFTMVLPLVILCIFAVISGWFGLTDAHGGLEDGGFFVDVVADSPYEAALERSNDFETTLGDTRYESEDGTLYINEADPTYAAFEKADMVSESQHYFIPAGETVAYQYREIEHYHPAHDLHELHEEAHFHHHEQEGFLAMIAPDTEKGFEGW